MVSTMAKVLHSPCWCPPRWLWRWWPSRLDPDAHSASSTTAAMMRMRRQLRDGDGGAVAAGAGSGPSFSAAVQGKKEGWKERYELVDG